MAVTQPQNAEVEKLTDALKAGYTIDKQNAIEGKVLMATAELSDISIKDNKNYVVSINFLSEPEHK